MRTFLTATLFAAVTACGQAPNDIRSTQQEIINGTAIPHSKHSSIVALTFDAPDSVNCTGTLIEPDVVLTAAHCVFSMQKMYVVYGLDVVDEEADAKAFHLSNWMTTHPDFSDNYGSISDPWSDIAIVVTNEPVVETGCARTATTAEQNSFMPVDELVTIAGYGRDESKVAGTLHEGIVPVVDIDDHEVIVGEYDLTLTSPGACHGDSGGPLYINIDGNEVVAGVTSRDASGTGVCGLGAVYTLTGEYNAWIEKEKNRLRCLRDADDEVEAANCKEKQKLSNDDSGHLPIPGGPQVVVPQVPIGGVVACPSETKESPKPKVDPAGGCSIKQQSSKLELLSVSGLLLLLGAVRRLTR